MINNYEYGLKFKDIPELQKHCQLFLDNLSSQGGPIKHAAKVIAGYWKNETSNEVTIKLNLNVY